MTVKLTNYQRRLILHLCRNEMERLREQHGRLIYFQHSIKHQMIQVGRLIHLVRRQT